MATTPWKLFIDTGGTFTDCLARDPAGHETRLKVLSASALRGRIAAREGDRAFRIETPWSGPEGLVTGFRFRLLHREHAACRVVGTMDRSRTIELDEPLDTVDEGAPFELLSTEEAPVLAARLVTGTPAGEALPPMDMRLATTRGTNALLTRGGTAPVLFVTRGFGDLLAIGDQSRPDLFAVRVEKPGLLVAEVMEVDGRMAADGSEVTPLQPGRVAAAAARQVAAGRRVAAVALMHADKNPAHEERITEILLKAGFDHVSGSAALTPFIKLLARAETAVVDAYLSPVIRDYLTRISDALGGQRLWAMTSAGGLVGAGSFRAKDSLLSGPAGGFAGAVSAGRGAGFDRVIAFDMGGTSTDVARYDGDFEYVFEHTVGGTRLQAPALAIESVAAGGGSVCGLDGDRLAVGPRSAGAAPGPACYGAGGPLTLTDINLLLGRISADRFGIPVERRAADHALAAVSRSFSDVTGQRIDDIDLLEGFLDIANQRMADAIRRVSLRRGYDPAGYALVAFGGAGPQHAVAVAGRLGVPCVLIPQAPALTSAQGLAAARLERFAERQVLAPLGAAAAGLDELCTRLLAEARDRLAREGIPAGRVTARRRIASLRFAGQDQTLEVEIEPGGDLGDTFGARYRAVFGHLPEGRDIELVGVRVVASERDEAPAPAAAPVGSGSPDPSGTAHARFAGSWQEVRTYERGHLGAGKTVAGPCLIFERYSTTVIEPGWEATVDRGGALVVRQRAGAGAVARRAMPEAVRLELFTHRLETIAREMGEALRRTAVSTNIKERLDFSCAILDPDGELVVNAPHIPVHLGSLGECVRAVTRTLTLGPGDTAVTNHPAYGGSHLPDVTLVSPAHDEEGSVIGYVASRAHHAELGGMLPGSMPPMATRLTEEGVVIPPFRLVHHGVADWRRMTNVLTGAAHPTRALGDNLADLRAALAANLGGVQGLRAMAREPGTPAIHRAMHRIKTRAETLIRQALGRLPDGVTEIYDELDDDAVLRVQIEVRGDRVRFDFKGTSGVHPGNLNATPAVVRSCVLYVLRLLAGDVQVPLNEGMMRRVDLRVPTGMLNPPFPDDPARAPAVMGGNVETSQRLANMLVRALGLAAASQGTMNNVTFGDARSSYYETVCGGCGAGPGFDGASAVHSHMTNTRITDPEVIEHRFPVEVLRFAIRPGSGGHGRHRGGDGVVREFQFQAPLSLAVLSQHRERGPAGLAGGGAGAPGDQRVERASGEVVLLGSVDSLAVGPGDRLLLKTPGGGGYGPAGEAPE